MAARRAECGYIFSEDLLEKLESGRFKRSITLVTAPSTAVDKLSSEVVFSGLFTVWGRSLLETYSREGEVFQGEKEVWKRLEPMYDHYLENGSTFAFQYETEGRTQLGKPSMKQTFPARGLTAVFIFVMGLTAAVTVCEDEKRGLFSTLSGLGREAAVFSCLAAPVFLSCVSGFAALAAAGPAVLVFLDTGGDPADCLWRNVHAVFLGTLQDCEKSAGGCLPDSVFCVGQA